MKDDIYRFRIDSFTPETLPMSRLAEYLAELAQLFGSDERVHFRKIQKGSAVLVSQVETVAVPKVRERLSRVDAASAADEVAEPFRRLDRMLAADNAVGKLRRGTATILSFPGRTAPRQRVGPVTQSTTVQGQLVRIGGRDKTAHGLIEDAGTGRAWKIVTTREQARGLAQVIYGQPLRVTGSGRWYREDDGRWQLEELRVQSWEALDDVTLAQAVESLRSISGAGWDESPDPLALLQKIRDGGGEVH